MSAEKGVVVVFVTCPPGEEATRLARLLVSEKLAACVNVVGPIRSLYWWEGKVQDDAESLLVIKTRAERFPRLRDRIQQEHPYEVPEILALDVVDGAPAYLDWVVQSVV